MPLKALIERIEAHSIPEPNSGCWLWTRAVNPWGYGNISVNGTTIGAHRASWIAHNDQIPAGLQVLHRCDIPSCVNPDHLWLGTDVENISDCLAKGRISRGRKHSEAIKAGIQRRSA